MSNHEYYWNGTVVTIETPYFDEVRVELDFDDAIEPMEAALALYVEIVAYLKGDGTDEQCIEADALDIWLNKLEVEEVFDNCNQLIQDQYDDKVVDLVEWMCLIVEMYGGKVPEELKKEV